MPTDSCLDAIVDRLNAGLIAIGVTSTVTGGFMILVFFAQYCLWRTYPEKAEKSEGGKDLDNSEKPQGDYAKEQVETERDQQAIDPDKQ